MACIAVAYQTAACSHALVLCRTEEGQPLVLSAVKQAEQRITADGKRNKVSSQPAETICTMPPVYLVMSCDAA